MLAEHDAVDDAGGQQPLHPRGDMGGDGDAIAGARTLGLERVNQPVEDGLRTAFESRRGVAAFQPRQRFGIGLAMNRAIAVDGLAKAGKRIVDEAVVACPSIERVFVCDEGGT